MSQPVSFVECLSPHLLTVEQVLTALQPLSHVIYLHDAGKPVIACFASRYQLTHQLHTRYFEAIGLNQYQESVVAFEYETSSEPPQDSVFTGFRGGLIGFIGYDHGAAQYIDVTQKDQPSVFLADCKSYLTQHRDGLWYFHSQDQQAEQQFIYLKQCLNHSKELQFSFNQPCQARWTQSEYQQAFNQVQNYIVAGDCYQINLTQEFTGIAEGHLLKAAQGLWKLTNAPYAGYVRIGDFELLSCSPELFIDFLPERKMITRPIKGTTPRFSDPTQDQASKQKLKHSTKDQAENVMIVDLLRNDLSVYAEVGSVKTPKLFEIESFNQVHHMVSEIHATLKQDISPLQVLYAALPGGSITGAPKIRAMQIIDELEANARGAYCGSLGYLNHDGTGSWNILIRSVQKYKNEVSVWAGGGITIASECESEYQECFDKVQAILQQLNTWYQPEQINSES